MDQPQQAEMMLRELAELRSELRQLRGEVAELREGRTAELQEMHGSLQAEMTNASVNLRRHITTTGRHAVREVEAMWQLFSKVPEFRAPLPPSGGFPMEVRSILHLSSLVEQARPQTVLELGGGTSTLWMGYLTQELGTRIISVDHLEDYRLSTSGYVERHGFSDRIDCRLAPLEPVTVEGEEYSWYSLNTMADLAEVDLLLVDGPPQATGAKARYPALPLLHRKLRAGAVVILDDTHRDDERAILEDWAQVGAGYEETQQGVSRLGVLRPLG